MLQNSPVTTRLMALDDARASGARALFGEKYGDEVRVVAMGEARRGNTLGWSVELCGGTHVRRTGDIGLISGLADTGVAAGVRRLEALTGTAARKAANHAITLAKNAAAEIKAPLDEMPARLAALHRGAQASWSANSPTRKKKLAMGGGARRSGEANGVRKVGDVKLMARAVSGIEIKDLKSLADEGKKQLGSGVVAIVGVTEDGKAGIVVGVTERSHGALQRGRPRAQGRRGARRQGRRRAARHGAGRRPGRRQGRCGARCDRGRARRLAHEQGVESRARHGIDTQALLDHVVRRRVDTRSGDARRSATHRTRGSMRHCRSWCRGMSACCPSGVIWSALMKVDVAAGSSRPASGS